ncbi:HvfC/BufC N-terminal domain-containing protein [Paraburkholderia susongensis]|uniref:Putative DNA-binding domain-containing protein n=1 Tax=Paraburkholderia susongensis TaxID=1515439 RepID=A0A1X7KEJ7_9BURK|nr:DNA-binding domain-containing protein [Paraburkholderia susongensis]SMG39709.1 Putative DNA-binding domain-containing protein [Paraburkholderia susongensis]
MTICAPTLLELQRAVRRDMLGLADGDASGYVVADGLAPQARLGIYRNTANSTLLAALRLTYPAVQALVGSEFFEGAARLFIEQCPPSSALLDSYGELFPEFLARMPEAASLVYLPDTARLEWAVNEALHAPDAKPLDLRRLEQLNGADMQAVRFLPSPAARVRESPFPVDAIWHAVLSRDDSALANINLAADPVWLYIHRGPSGVEMNRMAEGQCRFTAALLAGRPLHDALVDVPDAETSVWLAHLLASGCFVDICLSNEASSQAIGRQVT